MTDKINAAYALGGPSLSVRVVKNLLHIPISHVVNVNFGGFQRAVNRLGCVYVDVDRDYFNDNHPPNGSPFDYATININPGYQKLCGSDALDYVRYRHFDDDLVRAARQQSFLSAAKEQIGLGRIFGDRKELLRIFGRYTQTDIARQNTAAILRLLKLAFEASKNPIREVHFRGDIGETYVTISADEPPAHVDEFRSGHASNGPRETATSGTSKSSSTSGRRARRTSSGLPRGVIFSRVEAENFVAAASTHLSFPTYYPRARLSRGRYLYGRPRVYDIFDRAHRRYRAYRIVVDTGVQGQYYGIQGTTWKAPPILDNPSTTTRMRGRTYELFYDGNRLRWSRGGRRAASTGCRTRCRTLDEPADARDRRSLSRVGDAERLRDLGERRRRESSSLSRRRHEQPARTHRRHRHRLRRPRHRGRLRRAGQRRLVHRHRRGEDRPAEARRDPDLRARPRGARHEAPRAPALLDRHRRRARARAAALRRRRHAADVLRATRTSAPSTPSSTRCRRPTSTRWS